MFCSYRAVRKSNFHSRKRDICHSKQSPEKLSYTQSKITAPEVTNGANNNDIDQGKLKSETGHEAHVSQMLASGTK